MDSALFLSQVLVLFNFVMICVPCYTLSHAWLITSVKGVKCVCYWQFSINSNMLQSRLQSVISSQIVKHCNCILEFVCHWYSYLICVLIYHDGFVVEIQSCNKPRNKYCFSIITARKLFLNKWKGKEMVRH